MCPEFNQKTELDDEFVNALALMHSEEEDSIEKLRCLLNVSIQKRYGRKKVIPPRLFKNAEWIDSCKKSQNIEENSIIIDVNKKETECLLRELFSDIPSLNKKSTNSIEVFTDLEDGSIERTSVPRISIPDEESSDGILCKVCNGAKLGPMILIECQNCEDIYHPLCHQPPVIDANVYDSRFVWNCSKCEINKREKPAKNAKEIKNVPEGHGGKSCKNGPKAKPSSQKRIRKDTAVQSKKQ